MGGAAAGQGHRAHESVLDIPDGAWANCRDGQLQGCRLSRYVLSRSRRTRLFDDVPKSYRLDLVSSTASSNGVIELQYRRHR
jgi:hypothetical protein